LLCTARHIFPKECTCRLRFYFLTLFSNAGLESQYVWSFMLISFGWNSQSYYLPLAPNRSEHQTSQMRTTNVLDSFSTWKRSIDLNGLSRHLFGIHLNYCKLTTSRAYTKYSIGFIFILFSFFFFFLNRRSSPNRLKIPEHALPCL